MKDHLNHGLHQLTTEHQIRQYLLEGVHPPSRVQRIKESMTRSTEAALDNSKCKTLTQSNVKPSSQFPCLLLLFSGWFAVWGDTKGSTYISLPHCYYTLQIYHISYHSPYLFLWLLLSRLKSANLIFHDMFMIDIFHKQYLCVLVWCFLQT